MEVGEFLAATVMGLLTARPRLPDVQRGDRDVPVPRVVAVSLAEHLHLGVGLVEVDGDVVEVLDELLDMLRLELGEVDRYP